MYRFILLIGAIWILVFYHPQCTKAQSESLKIGAATKIITPELGSWVQGAGVPRKASAIRDDLEANGIYFSKGELQLLLVSCDVAGIEPDLAVQLREAMAVASGIPPRNILISATHTHGGPSLLKTNYLMPLDTAYKDKLVPWMVELAREAVDSAQPGKIGWAEGEVQIGYNRRLTWADGTHSMHGDATREDFTGLEGPDDPQHLALFAADLKGNLLSVLYHNTTHPTIHYADGIFSADFPGEVRKTLRQEFGGNLPVLFLNGAQGDISMDNMLDRKSESDEEKIRKISDLVVRETMRLFENLKYETNPVLEHDYYDLKVKVRLPETESLIASREVLKRIDDGEDIRGMEMIMAFGAVHLQDTFGENPFDILPVHAVRIGDLAMVTQPCELFSQFGLDIKRRSPGNSTIVVGMTDGYNGYCPTVYGLLGGGYSGAPISWTRLDKDAGYKIVEISSILLNKLWTK
ncbi:MAG: hypothetical protein WD431_19705 [Cyclobacteriaceae bacterium]